MGKLSADSWFRGDMELMRTTAKNNSNKKKKKKNNNNNTMSNFKEVTIGVLSFEVASLMSEVIHLWHSLGDDQIVMLKDKVFHMDGVRKLVSDDEDYLLMLALFEIMDSLRFLACSVARLGKKCTDPVLQRFDHVFTNLISTMHASAPADVLFGFQYTGKKMDRKVKKMKRLVAASSNLYHELEVLAEFEHALRRMKVQAQAQSLCSLADFKHRVTRQRQEVKCRRKISLWNRTYNYTVRLLARSLFTILGRITCFFESYYNDTTAAAASVTVVEDKCRARGVAGQLSRCRSAAGLIHCSVHPSSSDTHNGGLLLLRSSARRRQHLSQTISSSLSLPPPPPPWKHSSNWKKTKRLVSTRSFGGCVVGGGDSPLLPSFMPTDGGPVGVLGASKRIEENANKEFCFRSNICNYKKLFLSLLDSRQKPLEALPSTLGAAALALHYANVIIVIEKLAASPHLIGSDARDDLYNMLPTSIRDSLRARLKTHAKNLTSSFCNPILAAERSKALTRTLHFLAPLAHNMIRWQSDRNFGQQHLVSRANILLVQTLYFANQAKSEDAITDLLVGLNYLWRFGRELNAKAITERASSKHCDDLLDSEG